MRFLSHTATHDCEVSLRALMLKALSGRAV